MSRQAILALAVLAGAILIAFLMVSMREEPEEEDRVELAPLVETQALIPRSGALSVLGSGTVQPREEVTIGAQVAGRLTYVNPEFREGGVVRSGAPLHRIDASDFQNRVRSARADVAAQDVAVLQAEEEVAIAEAELERFAGRRMASGTQRAAIDSNDYAARILPPEGLDVGSDAEPPADASSASPNRLATREPQLRSALAARERAAANLADARLARGRTTIRAPFTGLVRSENVSPGALVQPGQALGTIVATAAFEVRVALTEKEAALVPGLLGAPANRPPAAIYFDFGGRTWRWDAFVDRAASILDPATRTIDLFVRVPNPLTSGTPVNGGAANAPPLLVGSFVRVEITGQSPETYFEIPVAALHPGNQIWVARDGKLSILEVRVIQRSDETAYVAVPEQFAGGRLVTSPLRAPIDGMNVRLADGAPVPAARTAPSSEADSDG